MSSAPDKSSRPPTPGLSKPENQGPWAGGIPSEGSKRQPWREFWPPKNLEQLSAEEREQQPWLTWKRDPSKPNDKPWYQWVNNFGSMVPDCSGRGNEPDPEPDPRPICPHCQGDGCVSSFLLQLPPVASSIT